MKNLLFKSITILFMFSIVGSTLQAAPLVSINNETQTTFQVKKLTKRLMEINDMDKSLLTKTEKQVLRKEVLSTQKQLKELDGGIYISVGAVIIILLLILIIF
jgi:uncharacterized membrane protein affecting hemolysin expression